MTETVNRKLVEWVLTYLGIVTLSRLLVESRNVPCHSTFMDHHSPESEQGTHHKDEPRSDSLFSLPQDTPRNSTQITSANENEQETEHDHESPANEYSLFSRYAPRTSDGMATRVTSAREPRLQNVQEDIAPTTDKKTDKTVLCNVLLFIICSPFSFLFHEVESFAIGTLGAFISVWIVTGIPKSSDDCDSAGIDAGFKTRFWASLITAVVLFVLAWVKNILKTAAGKATVAEYLYKKSCPCLQGIMKWINFV